MERKVAAGAVAGAVTTIGVWIASLQGLEVPAEIATAFATVFTAVVSWFVPNRPE